MTKRQHVGVGLLGLLVVGALGVVVTQGVDPTGRAAGDQAPQGLFQIQSELMDGVTVFPAPGATDVPVSWDGKEVPQPPPPPGGYPSGPVVTVQSQTGDLEVGSGRLMLDGIETLVAVTLLRYGEDSAMPRGTVAVIPHEPLAALTTYRAVFEDPDGEVIADWPFTTGAEQCDPTAQDCGRGQGCYYLDGKAMCIWAGAVGVGESCAFLNDCGPGLLCFRNRCRPYCDSSESADPDVACDAHCAQGGDDIVGAETLPAKVCLGANCLLKDVGCPEGESCYRFNGPFLCAPTGEAPAGAACERPNDCATGSICVGLNDSFACRLLCDGDGRPACEEVCSDGFRDASEDPLVRYCR